MSVIYNVDRTVVIEDGYGNIIGNISNPLITSGSSSVSGTVSISSLPAVQIGNTSSQPVPVSLVADGYTGLPVITSTSSSTGIPPSSIDLVGGVYQLTPPSLTSGSLSSLQFDVNSNLQSNLATSIAGEDFNYNRLAIIGKYNYTYISTQTTTIIKYGPGLLHTINFQPLASGVITIYDNTAGSGSIIFSSTQPSTLLGGSVCSIFDIQFNIGLTIVTSGANQTINISWI